MGFKNISIALSKYFFLNNFYCVLVVDVEFKFCGLNPNCQLKCVADVNAANRTVTVSKDNGFLNYPFVTIYIILLCFNLFIAISVSLKFCL